MVPAEKSCTTSLYIKKHRDTKKPNSKHWMWKYPNLIRQLEPTAPEQLWVPDITYLQTVSGNAYLHLVTDACSKQIMEYELCTDMKTSSAKKALNMALKTGNIHINKSIILIVGSVLLL